MAAAYDGHEAVKFRLQAAIWHLGQVRVCQHKSGSPDRWMRLVPSRFFGMEGGAGFLGNPEEQISSTRIRAALTNISDKHEMVRALSGIALSPGLLFDYIQKHKREEARLLEQQKADAQDQEWELLEARRQRKNSNSAHGRNQTYRCHGKAHCAHCHRRYVADLVSKHRRRVT
jgi:hypothetical protein